MKKSGRSGLRSSIVSRQRHNRLCAHRDIATPSQMRDKSGASTVSLAGLGADDTYGLAVELELHLRVRRKARPLANFSRNGHLAFGRDAHVQPLTRKRKESTQDGHHQSDSDDLQAGRSLLDESVRDASAYGDLNER